MVASAPPVSPPDDGPVVGPYRLVARIGGGEHGEVFAAVAPDGSTVALKRLRPAGADTARRAESARRIVAEAALARRLVHPGIVRILDAGQDAAGAWLAMELLSGCSLVRYTRAARLLPEPIVLRVGERLARALAHAHAAGVVHRDLKPANVVVDWAADRVTITDFGVARAADAAEAERTATGVILGSPGYMAPEQLAGAPADARGDVYALGVTLHELLAGRRPHDGASLGELLRAVAEQPPPDLRASRPELPPALAALVARMLAKRPDQRPSAAEAADALRALADAMQAPSPRPMSRPTPAAGA